MRIATLLWDDWNEDHITRHGVSAEEVEEVCANPGRMLRRARGGTYIVFGCTTDGRELVVILVPRGPEPSFFYPITARAMTHSERRYFRARKGSK